MKFSKVGAINAQIMAHTPAEAERAFEKSCSLCRFSGECCKSCEVKATHETKMFILETLRNHKAQLVISHA